MQEVIRYPASYYEAQIEQLRLEKETIQVQISAYVQRKKKAEMEARRWRVRFYLAVASGVVVNISMIFFLI